MRALAVVVFVVVGTSACPIGVAAKDTPQKAGEGEGEGDNYPTPNNTVAVPIGAEDTLEIGAWNLKNFPCGNSSFSTLCRNSADSTPSLVADLLYSLRVDLIGVEEIDSKDAFDEVAARLPDHDGVLSTHTYSDGSYQRVGFLYDTRVLTLESSKLIFDGNFDFPRPPMEAAFTYHPPTGADLELIAIDVHLKAGEAPEDHDRRLGAIASLENYVRGKVDGSGVDAVILMGDFNDVVTDNSGRAVFAPLLDASRYTVRTQPLADAGQESFVFSGNVIDHIVTTTAFDTAATTLTTVIPRLEDEVDNYTDLVSDHLPVFTQVSVP